MYRVGPLVSPKEAEMAAVLAAAPNAILSHRSAAALWELIPQSASAALVEITVPGPGRPRRPGIRAHRARSMDPAHVTTVEGIPVTVPARTILDLAREASPRELERALARAEREGLTSRAEVLAVSSGAPTRRGVRALRRLLDAGEPLALTRSEAEDRLLALIRKAQLPGPEVNAMIGGYEADFLWRTAGVVVEVDGFAFHSSRSRFEADRRRDGRLSARGLRVVRVTWDQIVGEPEATLVRIAQTLALARRG